MLSKWLKEFDAQKAKAEAEARARGGSPSRYGRASFRREPWHGTLKESGGPPEHPEPTKLSLEERVEALIRGAWRHAQLAQALGRWNAATSVHAAERERFMPASRQQSGTHLARALHQWSAVVEQSVRHALTLHHWCTGLPWRSNLRNGTGASHCGTWWSNRFALLSSSDEEDPGGAPRPGARTPKAPKGDADRKVSAAHPGGAPGPGSQTPKAPKSGSSRKKAPREPGRPFSSPDPPSANDDSAPPGESSSNAPLSEGRTALQELREALLKESQVREAAA
ncbi:hypothetical protein CYMTET_9658 [Cymbomonas tetramitiformis]|uniref:Uncharacterized protein n=1 Tax=Cymbomonas tetramitiformis TaxID=36881 RepID=A0AAE0GR09_9CHLO|nr:hypothetical protein CYMTET_9658 [Cymbomonas tetramitiformis]